MSSILYKFKGDWQLPMIAFFMFISTSAIIAQNDGNETSETDVPWEVEVMENEFKAGEMIIEHITDSYEWHIMTIGHTHVSVPLPIMLYDDGKFHFFMSSVFHHHETHNGYFISHNDMNAGKLVKSGLDGQEIRPTLDFSFTKNVLAIFISCFIMIWVFISVAKSYKRREGQAPKGLQSFLEPVIIFVRDDIAKASIGEKNYRKYLPFLLTIFFFIFLNNLMGIVPFFPGGANVTGNIGVTAVLALFTFAITTFSGNKNYWVHIINTPGVPWWLKIPVPLMPIVEIMGIFTKPFVLMVRLFANISAGHIIILGFISLIFIFGEIVEGAGYGVAVISVGFSIFMDILELLVAFIQAYVFTLLSALYFGMATEEAHH
ncbi:MAG: F0F1 ATP synthase subunit A [Bacteroidales bacterium]|jgi:F-type H+-transporting ATPase subunit a|nr:ATP synthase F0 subunit A [Lentimicrobiaceae bacterium]MDG1135502.1 F0F1 ATP synthase subunit A [Bacteroidales bacterium]MDG1901854.1 F0F1 ATP synthase subunit A [Bacteroidales bacterium]MDG2080463.1 F0F1 ATP synthase subunit A [Bacteroidales bacterium]|tara:strand:+ start:31045 stop:32169 length:1125 start_codon:yes stop_codon:yes gene_type:complete